MLNLFRALGLSLAVLLAFGAPSYSLDYNQIAGNWTFTVKGKSTFNMVVAVGKNGGVAVGAIGNSKGAGKPQAKLSGNVLTVTTAMTGYCEAGAKGTLVVRFSESGEFKNGTWSGVCRGRAFDGLRVQKGRKS